MDDQQNLSRQLVSDQTVGAGQGKLQGGNVVGLAQPTQSVSYIPASMPEAGGARIVSSELVRPEQEPVIPAEVREAGVKQESQVPQIPPDVKAFGVQLAKEVTPVKLSPSSTIKLPYTDAQAEKIVKADKDTRESRLWLATLVLRELHAQAVREQSGKAGGNLEK